ncbi:MAG: hypothetical protein ABIE22_03030 [archaeon]
MNSIVKISFINSIGTTAYIIAIASFLYFLQTANLEENTVLIPIAMLMLFVFSAAFTGSLVFGRPAIWYLNGKKKDALYLLAYTLGIFFLITILVFLLLILYFR